MPQKRKISEINSSMPEKILLWTEMQGGGVQHSTWLDAESHSKADGAVKYVRMDVFHKEMNKKQSRSDWRPINTAPDDELVLIFAYQMGCAMGRYSTLGSAWKINGGYVTYAPDFWMPLPEPPQ